MRTMAFLAFLVALVVTANVTMPAAANPMAENVVGAVMTVTSAEAVENGAAIQANQAKTDISMSAAVDVGIMCAMTTAGVAEIMATLGETQNGMTDSAKRAWADTAGAASQYATVAFAITATSAAKDTAGATKKVVS